MQILPLPTPLLHPGSDLAKILCASGRIERGDILVVSSKAVATCEGAMIDLGTVVPSAEAKEWSPKTGRSSAFCQAVLDETARMHGRVLGSCQGGLLTELKPDGMTAGVILAPNAGLDESNVPQGYTVGWPVDPVTSARGLRMAIEERLGFVARAGQGNNVPALGIIISDSCCRPRRLGVTAYALTVSGFPPLKSEVGTQDLFARLLKVTVEARADQLAVAGNSVMGNAAQSTPAAIIRDHGITLGTFEGWVPGIEPDQDLYKDIFKA